MQESMRLAQSDKFYSISRVFVSVEKVIIIQIPILNAKKFQKTTQLIVKRDDPI